MIVLCLWKERPECEIASERTSEQERNTNKNLCRNISTSLSFHWFNSLVFSFPPIQGFFHDILNGIARLFVVGSFGAFFIAVYYVLKQALAQTRNDYSMSKARLIFLSLSLSSNVVGPHFVVFHSDVWPFSLAVCFFRLSVVSGFLHSSNQIH